MVCIWQKEQMTPRITIYQKPSCTTCRNVYKILSEEGVDFDAIDYFITPIPKEKMRDLLKKMGIGARELLRTKEPMYKDLQLAHKELSEEKCLDLMVKHPELIQRPIIEKGSKAIIARPAERIREFLGS